MIVLNPGYNESDYKLAASYIVKTGVRMEPTLRPGTKIWVKFYWTRTGYNAFDEAIMDVLAHFGEFTSEMSYMEFPEGEDEDADYLRGKQTANRTVRMKLFKN